MKELKPTNPNVNRTRKLNVDGKDIDVNDLQFHEPHFDTTERRLNTKVVEDVPDA